MYIRFHNLQHFRLILTTTKFSFDAFQLLPEDTQGHEKNKITQNPHCFETYKLISTPSASFTLGELIAATERRLSPLSYRDERI